MFTDGAARAIGEDAALVPGRPATFTVLAGDPLAESPAALREMDVATTFRDGREIAPPAGTVVWQG